MEDTEGSTGAAESKPPQYDVFINHRGEDVKKGFVGFLYSALSRNKFRPFLDAKCIARGSHIFKSIDEALKGARVHVAVFSKGYAGSKHCLKELYDMLESGKDILPVFYDVNPEDLRWIENGPFEEGFRKHIDREGEEQILQWKEALCKICDYRGFRLDEVNGDQEQFIELIVVEVQRLMTKGVLPDPGDHPFPGDHPGALSEGNGTVAFNSGDRRLNILVLGDSEDVVNRICGAGRPRTQNSLTENKNSWPPICLYMDTEGINRNDFTDIKNFVKIRNERWHRSKVEDFWADEVRHSGPPGERSGLFPDSTLRLHMVWFVCKKISDLPNRFNWSGITKKLYDLPVQILVTGMQDKQDLDSLHRKILEDGSHHFPNAQNLEDVIVKVDLSDGDLKENLWRNCWAAKTRAEIGNAAKIIREMRKELGSSGISVNLGVGGSAGIRKEVSLSKSADFVLHFLCTYWDIPQDKMHGAIQRMATFEQAPGNTFYKIKPCEFVKFCLIVAAIILDKASANPEYVYNWDVTSESSSENLQMDARRCYNSYFVSSNDHLFYYDQMRFREIQKFLQDIFERKGGVSSRERTPRHMLSADRDSIGSKIMKLICRGRNGMMLYI